MSFRYYYYCHLPDVACFQLLLIIKVLNNHCSNHVILSIKDVEAKLHGESRVIQRCFDDNKDDDKGDDKKLKRQSKNEFKIFKIESRTLQDSKGKLISRMVI